MKLKIAICAAFVALLVYGVSFAQEETPTPDPHHPAAGTTPEEITPAPVPEATDSAGMGQMGGTDVDSTLAQMQGMMDMMMGMEMSGEMMSVMQQMQRMMGMMSGSNMPDMVEQMQGMMDMMMGMEMSGEMMSMMQQMQGMMEMLSGSDGGGEMDHSMDMEGEMGGMAMDDGMGAGGHAMQPISSEGVPAASESIGGQPLDFRLEDDVKVFELTAQPVLWNILDNVTVTAWTYNGTVPGPMIRVTEGDQVRLIFRNELPEPTTIHWHGISVPNAMDGVPDVTQDAVLPGETFTYEFTASPAGTFMYHSHFESDTQVSIGLYAPFIIDPVQPEEPAPDVDVTLMLSEWRVVDGQTFPAMPMTDADPNYFTINGKAFPATETINVELGQRVRLRVANIGQFSHPMHLHGMPFQIVATDGHPVPAAAQLTKDTVNVAPGERYDIEFVATAPGQWVFHCHILHHATNDGVEPGGLMLVVNVTE